MDEVLKRLIKRQEDALAKRSQIIEARKAIVEVAKRDLRDDLNDEEDTEFRAKGDEMKLVDEEIDKLNERIAEMRDEDDRTKRAADAQRRLASATSSLRVNEGEIYTEDNIHRSYFLDLGRANLQGDNEARQRLDRHAQDVQNRPEYRDLTRVDGSGGQFVPPAYLMDRFLELKRAGRATANAVQNLPLPSGTDSLNIPRLATGTATAIQAADNAVVQETDPSDALLTVPVRTISGQVDVAIQLLDQSPIAIDQMLLTDLIRAYNTNVGAQVLTGSGASGQVTGALNTGSIATVTYTDATPTVAELWNKLADAINRVSTGIYSEPNLIVMHPRRWAWFLSALDAQSRPLVVPSAGSGQAVNAMGTVTGPTGGIERVVGQIMGVNVITDTSIPTTYSAGAPGAGTEDVILVLDTNETYLYESAVRTRVLPEVGSGTLTVRLQIYGYVAFTAGRYPASLAQIVGSGMVAPTF